MSVRDLFKPVDMTEGDPVKKIVAFSIPMLIGNIAQQLYFFNLILREET